MARRVGLTTRVEPAPGYDEPRDCLAQNWGALMAAALPEVAWLPVPNLGAGVVAFAEAWALDGFIFTGGADLGRDPSRDATEAALLDYAQGQALPVFGVCRGLQLIQAHAGGALAGCARADHVATRHPVTLLAGTPYGEATEAVREVNSFHQQAVALADLAPDLRPFALSAEGWVEGLYHPGKPVVAVQWHPERGPLDPADRALLRRALQVAP